MPIKVHSPHRWPAEWEPQAATWIAWPRKAESWPGRFERIPALFEKLVQVLAQVQRVDVISGSSDGIDAAIVALNHVRQIRNVFVHSVDTNDAWIRDYGPTFVKLTCDDSLVGVDWQYNAWGRKYPPYELDARACEEVCRLLRCMRSRSALYCEGGALEGNGHGVVMTTSSCLLSPARNPGWRRSMIEDELRAQLGVDQVVWLDGGGLQGDDTDGHVDQIARFVNPTTIVAATSSHPDDPNRPGLEDNLRTLRSMTLQSGEQCNVVPLPTPPPRTIDEQRVPESYCNFVLANGIVVVPTFRCSETDQNALDTLGQLFPDRKLIPLDAYDLVWGLGALHCITQQQPA